MHAQTEKMAAPTAGRLRANRLFAVLWNWMSSHESEAARTMRERIVSGASGSVLEIGCGTGASFSYYASGAHVIATDPDAEMLSRAERKLRGSQPATIELRQAAAEALPFADGSFDHVVSCWVLCHVDDAAGALTEVRRVLRPDGAFRVMDHVRSESRVWGRSQDVFDPIWSRLLGAGCHVNRRTQQAIESAGFRFDWVERARLSPPTSPAVYGVARLA
jgi:ubiquinone/menaquinone biosynthesis C-methylase UbiE